MADDHQQKWCFAWLAGAPAADGQSRAALLKANMWPPASVIRIAFLDGDPAVQARVRAQAVRWTKAGGGPANLTFSFVPDPATADVRISFLYSGSWSVIGTTCRNVPQGQPTMNFGWLRPETPDDELRRVVLHEFGHAIGLVHEHLQPNVDIHWDKPRVYQDLSGPPNNWNRETIDLNMFDKFPLAEMRASAFDPQSIMLYAIPATWTTDGFSTTLNVDLSDADQKLVREEYR